MNNLSKLKKLKITPPTTSSNNLEKEVVNKNQTIPVNRFRQLSNRTIQVATKLTPETYDLLQKIAYEKRWKNVEVIEQAIENLAKELNIS